jgi:Fe-S-cluster containining protein
MMTIPSGAQARRELLIEDMRRAEAAGFDCRGCAGVCCTYEANSMMITPLEAMELFIYLSNHGKNTPELKTRLQENVTKYRLDSGLGNGKRSFLRRSYTCPFFNHQELGCPLPPEVKPFGCLAFNSHHQTEKASEHCYSEKVLLEKREQLFSQENAKNRFLREKYQLYWEKLSIPMALLDLWDKEIISSDLESD